MRIPAVVTASVFLLTHLSLADCDAPGLSLPATDGVIHGVRVSRLQEGEDADRRDQVERELVAFGDDLFALVAESGSLSLQEIAMDPQPVKRRLLDSLVPGEFYLGAEEQTFSVHEVAAYDLDGDLEADLVFFGVSPGANVYSGVVGVVGEEWVTVIEPSCY